MRRLYRFAIFVWVTGVLVGCGVNAAERNNTGNALYSQGDYSGALQAYQAAQVADPSLPQPYYNAASALAQTGELEAALQSLQQALKSADPDLTAEAYYNLGNVYFEMEQYQDAVTSYQQTLLLRPDDRDARYNYELALSRVFPVTPTALEQQTNPEQGETDPNVTPTNNPGALDGPTPTPPPQEGPPDPTLPPQDGGDQSGDTDSLTPTPQPEGPLSVEEARQLLDSVQQDQQTLQQYLNDISTPSEPPAEDW